MSIWSAFLMPFLPFVYGYVNFPTCSLYPNKNVPTLCYTRRPGPIHTGPCLKALTECSPLDFQRSSIKAQHNLTKTVYFILSVYKHNFTWVKKVVHLNSRAQTVLHWPQKLKTAVFTSEVAWTLHLQASCAKDFDWFLSVQYLFSV